MNDLYLDCSSFQCLSVMINFCLPAVSEDSEEVCLQERMLAISMHANTPASIHGSMSASMRALMLAGLPDTMPSRRTCSVGMPSMYACEYVWNYV